MTNPTPRIAAGLLGLVALWIGVYWWWPSSGQPRGISFSRVATGPGGVVESGAGGAGGTSGGSAGEAKRGLAERAGDSKRGDAEAGAGAGAEGGEAGGTTRPIAVIPPEFILHRLAAGETYATLSLRYYGTSAYATAIAKANPLMSPTSLRPGREVRVPKDPKNIQGIPVERPAPGRGAKAAEAGSELATEYVVESGDTLSKIAGKLYGDSTLSGHIFAANKGALRDEDSLAVGQKLRIPPKPTP